MELERKRETKRERQRERGLTCIHSVTSFMVTAVPLTAVGTLIKSNDAGQRAVSCTSSRQFTLNLVPPSTPPNHTTTLTEY